MVELVEVMVIAGDYARNLFLMRNLEGKYILYSLSLEDAPETAQWAEVEEARRFFAEATERMIDAWI